MQEDQNSLKGWEFLGKVSGWTKTSNYATSLSIYGKEVLGRYRFRAINEEKGIDQVLNRNSKDSEMDYSHEAGGVISTLTNNHSGEV